MPIHSIRKAGKSQAGNTRRDHKSSHPSHRSCLKPRPNIKYDFSWDEDEQEPEDESQAKPHHPVSNRGNDGCLPQKATLKTSPYTDDFLIQDEKPHDVSDNEEEDDGWDNFWFDPATYNLLYERGSDDRPANRMRSIPLWVLHYFNDPQKSLVFAQILYWFGPDKSGRPRANRRDGGRRVLDKTFAELAHEVGIANPRRIGKVLKGFQQEKLIGYKITGIGRGRKTRIWLNPREIMKAYHRGAEKLESIADGRL